MGTGALRPAACTRRLAVYLVTTDNSSGTHQVKYPYFTTVRRGLYHGIQPVVLPTPAGCSRLDLLVSSCRVDRQPTSCVECPPGAPAASTPAHQRAQTFHRADPQTALRGL